MTIINTIKQCNNCKLKTVRNNVVVSNILSYQYDGMVMYNYPNLTDDLKGYSGNGDIWRLFRMMVDAACKVGLLKDELFKKPLLYFTYTLLCYPTNNKGGDLRDPTIKEIFYCRENIIKIYEYLSPKFVILIGDLPKAHYKKTFKNILCIPDLEIIKKMGGVRAPFYNSTVRNIQDLFLENMEKI